MKLDINSGNDIYVTGYTMLETWNSSLPDYGFIAKINSSIPTSPLSVLEEINPNNFNVYPNLSSEKVFLDFSGNKQEKQIEVFSYDGRKIKSLSTFESGISLEIEQNGIYLINVLVDDKVFTKKVVIQ